MRNARTFLSALRSGALANVFGDTLVTATGNSDYPDAANQLPYVMRNSAT